MEEKKRIRRSAEERVAEIDAKIDQLNESLDTLADKREEAIAEFDEKEKKLQEKIKTLTKKKEDILSPEPKKRRPRMTKKRKINDILSKAVKAGLTPEDISELLGLQDAPASEETDDTASEE